VKSFFKFWLKAIPFTLGMALSIISLCFLIKFYDYGLNFEDQNIWFFCIFFFIGFPTLTYGINKLRSDDDNLKS
jgi:hypothetical protein